MFIHADLDAFFASVEQKLNPSLRGQPVIVTNTDPQGRLCFRGIVSTCSYEARKFGVRSGMSVWEARKLCPQGVYVQGKFDQYQRHSTAFFEILNRFSPDIEPISLDEGFVNLAGAELLYKDFAQTAKKIKETIKKELGITGSIGLAKTRIVAKVASDFSKPDGLTVVPLGQEKSFLAPLPLRKLPGVGVKTEPYLQRLLQKDNPTIGNLANQSPAWIRENLGQAGLNLWQAANGIDSVWFVPQNKPRAAGIASGDARQQSISRSVTFPSVSNNPQYLLAQLRFLTEKVASELFQENLTTSCISVAIRTKEFKNYSTQTTCLPLWQPSDIFSLVKRLFLKLYQPLTLLRLVGIGANHLTQKNPSLFAEKEDKKIKLAQGLQKIRNKYHFETLLPASSLFLA